MQHLFTSALCLCLWDHRQQEDAGLQGQSRPPVASTHPRGDYLWFWQSRINKILSEVLRRSCHLPRTRPAAGGAEMNECEGSSADLLSTCAGCVRLYARRSAEEIRAKLEGITSCTGVSEQKLHWWTFSVAKSKWWDIEYYDNNKYMDLWFIMLYYIKHNITTTTNTY